MVKRFDSTHRIHVDLTFNMSKDGFEFVWEEDLGELGDTCSECGHPIRYVEWYKNKLTGDEVGLGRECQFKLYVFMYWRDQVDKDNIDVQLLRAGKWLWVLHRDELASRAEKIPQPRDYDDYKVLANDMRKLVFSIRKQLKEEEEKKFREEERKRLYERKNAEMDAFLAGNGIKKEILSDKDKDFLSTALKCYKNHWSLSEKQQKWFDNIIKKSADDYVVPNLGERKSVGSFILEEDIPLLNEWEKNFMNSIQQQVERGYALSEKQSAKIESIRKKLYPSNGNGIFMSKIVKVLENIGELNEWEKGFIQSIKNALRNGFTLSQKQEAILNKLYDKF